MSFSIANITQFLPDILGICGVLLVLWAYFSLQIGKCSAESLYFSVANLVGSVLLLVSLWFSWNLASVIIEVVWLFLSLYGVIRILFRPKLQTKDNLN